MASDEHELDDPVDGFDVGFPGTDLTLVVEGQKIQVNKAVLSEHLPVFNTMFNSNFKESTSKEIELEDKKAADVVEFLKCFYPNMKHPVTGDNVHVLQVLPLAHKYQSPLVATCEDFMSQMCKPDKGLTVSTLLDYILAGEKYGLTSFLEAAIEFSAHVYFELLNGKMTIKSRVYCKNVYDETIDNSIFLKFLKIDLDIRLQRKAAEN
nr:kelch-like protein 7 isoform X1 [Crassostrea gigas]